MPKEFKTLEALQSKRAKFPTPDNLLPLLENQGVPELGMGLPDDPVEWQRSIRQERDLPFDLLTVKKED